MKKLLRLLVLLLLFFAVQVLSGIVAFALGLALGIGSHYDEIMVDYDILSFSLFLSNLLLCITFFLFKLHKSDALKCHGLRVGDFVLTCMLMFPVIFVVNLLVEFLNPVDFTKDAVKALAYNPLGICTIVLLAPFAEELFFRMGCLKICTESGLNPWVSILISASVFGAIHGNPAQILGAIPIGVLLGWLYWRSGSIWLPFAAHALNNLLGLVLLWMFGGEELTMNEVNQEIGFPWLFVLLNLVFAYSLFVCLNRRLSIRAFLPEKEKGNDVICSEVHRNGDS